MVLPDATDVFAMVRLLPPEFNPSMVTLSAPSKLIRWVVILPVMVRPAPPLGWLRILV